MSRDEPVVAIKVDPAHVSKRRWIETAVEMSDATTDGNYYWPHWLMAHKVLGEPREEAMALAVRFGRTPLDRDGAYRLAAEWWTCDGCGADAPGGKLCAACASPASTTGDVS